MPVADIFSEEFLKLDPADISKAVCEKGFFSFPAAVKREFLAQLEEQIAPYKPGTNLNSVAPVWFNEQYFFPHALAVSKNYFDYITASFLREVSRQKFGSNFRLKCHRYYETGYGHSMEWHADNVTNEGVVTGVDGLIFILYVNDVYDGEFQLVRESFRERQVGSWAYNYTNQYIEEKYANKIETFGMPAGSLIVYDTFGIHRAKPIINKSFTRKSIFFQVDSNEKFAEQLFLNPTFFDKKVDDDLLSYLGFGKKHDYFAVPISSINDVPTKHLFRFEFDVLRALLSRVQYGFFQVFLSHDQRMRFNRWRREFSQNMKEKHPQTFGFLKRVKRKLLFQGEV